MSYRPFKVPGLDTKRATLATAATLADPKSAVAAPGELESVAAVATVGEPENVSAALGDPVPVASVATVARSNRKASDPTGCPIAPKTPEGGLGATDQVLLARWAHRRPKGYTDKEWLDALADAKRLGYPPKDDGR